MTSQHALMVRVLCEAGAQPIEEVVPASYAGKIADVLFADDDVIVEVKSLTTDRAAAPSTAEAVGQMFSRSTHLGAPVIFGTVDVRLHDLDPRVAANTLRIAGRRVLDEAKAANAQIKATKAVLGRPNALGVIAIITPPFKLDRRSIAWAMGDAMRDGRCGGIGSLFLVETPIASPSGTSRTGNSFLSFYSRPGLSMPGHLSKTICAAWGRITGQPGHRADESDFHRFGATS